LKIRPFKAVILLTICISLLLLSACDNLIVPFDSDILNQSKDEVAPVITIVSPENEESYGARIYLSGSVSDLSDGGEIGQVSFLTYEIIGISEPENIVIDDEDNFQIILETSGAGYSSDIRIKMTALDWNGNSAETTLSLIKSSGDLTSFTVNTGNSSAQLNWDTVPGAVSYTIEELTSRHKVENILVEDLPFQWGNLTNGNLYYFRVSAIVGEETFYSSTEYALPLSETTLTPHTESVYKGINIEWDSIPGTSSYILERSDEQNGYYTRITKTTSTSFSDSRLERDASYFYRVIPEELFGGSNELYSNAVFGTAGFFPSADNSIIASLFATGSVGDIEVSGNYAYVADSVYELQIIDVSNPEFPFVRSIFDDYSVSDVTVLGDWAYVLSGENNRFNIIDITNPDNPIQSGSKSIGSGMTSIAVSGNRAFITQENAGLCIIDLSNPELSIIHSVDTPGTAYDVVVSGDYAYIADGAMGLQVIDVSAVIPSIVATCNTSGTASGVTISGNYAFVADGSAGLKIIDISDPLSPEVADSITTPDDAKAVSVTGNYAYVATSGSGLSIIAINEPGGVNAPRLSAVRDTPGSAIGIAVNGEYAYIADDSKGLQICEIGIPEPIISGNIGISDPQDLVVSGGYAYIANDTDGIEIIDISDSSNPVSLGSLNTAGLASGIKIAGNYAYMSNETEGVHVFDIGNPASPVLVGVCNTPNFAMDIDIKGDLAFVADEQAGLQVLSISDPESPEIIGASNTFGQAEGIALSGDYAFLADGSMGLIAFNISNPRLPVEIDSITSANPEFSGISIQGEFAFVADKDFLRIIDISDPSSLAEAGFIQLPTGINNVSVLDNYVYVIDFINNIRIIDISDPGNPYIIDELDLGFAANVAVSGEYAYVVGSSGLQVLDLYQEN